jgi:hypothetical protein
MRKLTPVLLLVTIVAAALLAVPVGAQDESDGVSLTIYNQGTALVQDRRTFNLKEGRNTLDFTDVAASIDATSVSFHSLSDPQGTTVLEQNFVYDLVGSGALLERYLDQRIEITTILDGKTFTGQLLSGRNGEIILRQDDGQVIVVQQNNVRDIRFPALPEGLITRPTLRWLLQAAKAGDQKVELTYLTGGMNWTADYIFLVANDNKSLDLNGWITLTNTSGAAFRDAKVKLVAGDVNRLPQPQAAGMAEDRAVMPSAAPMEKQVEQRNFNEYKLYEIQRPVTVGNNETKQVEFVTAASVPATTYYVYNASVPYYGYYSPIIDQGAGITSITDVQNWLEFTTGKESGLDAALPAGRVRVYQKDTDDSALLIGENTIDHTAKGEKVKVYLGNAFDLVGERRQTNFQYIGNNVLEETYEIHLRNRKENDAVQIRVPERLFRWSNWEIVSKSDEFTKLDSSTIEFRVDVKPGEEKVITYTVRYTWPR